MTDIDANNIIESVMKAHWPKWEFKGQELRVWLEELRKFDYETAKYAINELYKTWQSGRYPKMPTIMGAIRKLSIAKNQSGKRTVALYTILRPDGIRRWWPFTGDTTKPRQAIERDAEIKRTNANRMYGDGHIIQYHSTDEPDKPEETDEQESKEEQEEIPF